MGENQSLLVTLCQSVNDLTPLFTASQSIGVTKSETNKMSSGNMNNIA